MFIIAEIGQAHDGSLGFAHSYIDALSDTGVDAVKFQVHIADAESSIHEPFRVPFSYEDSSRMDYWRRMEFLPDQWAELKKHCDDVSLEFMATPFSNMAVDLLEKVGVKRYKIGSGELSNYLLLEKIAKTGKPVILSTGMSSFDEIEKSVQFLMKHQTELSILQCTTSYPAKPEEWGMNVIAELKRKYNLPIGFSDHSGDIYACLAATALGAEILEFHVVFDKRMFGPDSKSSLTPNEIKKLVDGVKKIERANFNPVDKSTNENYRDVKRIFEKSLAVNRNLKKGEVLQFEDLESKKPKGYGIDASQYREVIGKKSRTNLKKWQFLTENNIENNE